MLENNHTTEFKDFYNDLDKFAENCYHMKGALSEQVITALILKNILDQQE